MKFYYLMLSCALLFSIQTANAAGIPATASEYRYAQDQEISFGQLPEYVQTAFEESLYAQWKIRKIERISPTQNVNHIIFKLTISNGVEEFSITFDQDGNFMG